MDLVPFIDYFGETSAKLIAGLGLGILFGGLLERSGFCTRSAVLGVFQSDKRASLLLWALAISSTILFVQLMIYSEMIDVTETRFFSTPQSISGAIVGGSLFGVGMALARGCASRLLVLGASGNLRAGFTVLILSLTAAATFGGFLAPLRDQIASFLRTPFLGGNDLVASFGLSQMAGAIIGGTLLAIAVIVAIRGKLSFFNTSVGLAIGALIAFGWYVTHTMAAQLFEPIQTESVSYIRPFADVWNFIGSGGSEAFLSVNLGVVAGTFLGAAFTSLVSGSFKFRTFSEPDSPHLFRYITGGIFMGFGGILAVGCTIGAGFTGGSVLATSSLIGLSAMLLACGGTEYLLRRLSMRNVSMRHLA